ncbi:glycosyltransferase [Alteromonas sp. D210916BOD_24]|uniref:glycosyltransferase n=1 Tax=Alteromonas sp. D210916BOD_24 TaxID=3157618 RepID=UPI00399CFF5F
MRNLVLHITECLGGGVETAIAKYIAESNLNTTEHMIFAISGRSDDSNGDILSVPTKTIIRCNLPFWKIPFVITQIYRKYQPKYVHLHSSFAGFYGRVALVPKEKIIYTPHCYSFLIESKPNYQRKFFKFIEKLLSYRTGVIASCGVYEEELSQSININSKIVPLNNAMTLEPPPHRKVYDYKDTSSSSFKLAMVGRVCEQKDPNYFAKVIKILKDKGMDVDALWIGGGDKDKVASLSKNKIKVTGWLNKEEAIEHLKNSDIYLHTARWEGNPVSLIEAAALNLPTFARAIGPTKVFGDDLCCEDENEAADAIISLVQGKPHKCNPYILSENIRAMNSVNELRRRLDELYR